jgi:hypothetical protein
MRYKEVVSRQPLTAEVRCRGWLRPCEIYGGVGGSTSSVLLGLPLSV